MLNQIPLPVPHLDHQRQYLGTIWAVQTELYWIHLLLFSPAILSPIASLYLLLIYGGDKKNPRETDQDDLGIWENILKLWKEW